MRVSEQSELAHSLTCVYIYIYFIDLRGWIKGTARALYPVNVERAMPNMANIERSILARWWALIRNIAVETLN